MEELELSFIGLEAFLTSQKALKNLFYVGNFFYLNNLTYLCSMLHNRNNKFTHYTYNEQDIKPLVGSHKI